MKGPTSSSARGWLKLTTIAMFILSIWIVVLPRVSRLNAVRNRIEHFQDRGIEPAAFFYDDHPASERWEQQVQSATQQNPAAFGFPDREE